MQLQLQFNYMTFSITIFTTKRYLESPSRQGRAPSLDLELAPRCHPWSLPDDADGWLEPLSRVDGILDADGERLSYQWRGLDLLGTASVKRGLDLLGVASGQRGVDEKELQRR
jgi:hypothetical protein